MRAYYFGCGNGVGHYWHAPGLHPVRARTDGGWRPEGCPWGSDVDGGTQPGAMRTPERPWASPTHQTQGPCALHRRDGWTLIGWWDRSVDRRGGSCSAFAAEGEHSFDEMLAMLREHFPWVASRLAFVLVPS